MAKYTIEKAKLYEMCSQLAPPNYDVSLGIVAACIDDLPNSPGNIGKLLVKFGVKGFRGQPWDCPLSKYIIMTTSIPVVSVGSFRIYPGDDETFPPRYIKPGDEIKKFIVAFDQGRWPQLDIDIPER